MVLWIRSGHQDWGPARPKQMLREWAGFFFFHFSTLMVDGWMVEVRDEARAGEKLPC